MLFGFVFVMLLVVLVLFLFCFSLFFFVFFCVFVLLGGFNGQVRWPPHLALDPPHYYLFFAFLSLFLKKTLFFRPKKGQATPNPGFCEVPGDVPTTYGGGFPWCEPWLCVALSSILNVPMHCNLVLLLSRACVLHQVLSQEGAILAKQQVEAYEL